MTTFVLELNDLQLRIFRDGAIAAESSGYAFIGGATVEYGDAARRQMRLHPRQASNQHWHRLAMDPLAIRGPNLANLADLVYGQLRELTTRAGITKTDELFVAAPGTVTPDQLGLLLGVAQELGVRITGLADAAVAASTRAPSSGQFVHIDVSLYRATVTSLDASDTIVRTSVQEIPDAGLSHLTDAWVNVVSDRFVTETRFDPLRIAETEQQVYNQVYDWMQQADHTGELIVETSHRDAIRRVTVPTAALIDKAVTRLRSLSDAVPAHGRVSLSHRAAAIPGIRRRLVADHATVDALPADAIVHGFAGNVERIRSDPSALKFVTRLPRHSAVADAPIPPPPPDRAAVPAARPEPPRAERATGAPSDARLPSHVLHRGRARSIGARLLLGAPAFPDGVRSALPERIVLVERADDGIWARPVPGMTTTLNDRPLAEPTRTRIGDVLRCGEHEFVLIRVMDEAS